ncbi:probable GTP-binding protein EngB [Aspergillus awamori]|uniref:GTP-binding protein 8 n=2 Tax=Aspergillus TaxID=5052 RepID=A0A3F3PX64_9EURO|nr:P-loop containing nucleoside triphosphate hydrolase protein [Aspergillus welwitschiae]GCB23071.1 probable GTP-binding protein EngB [Aspergillus awamori]GKZ61086.1 hypothetical protein AnigIFM49718_007791 [Aspergillus niger]RDH31509.1 P-loop containing nucleoside triphosphate hydrolase protein [Aspergillus welwitschiae]GKZ64324.1 hypothetical protein AnigIFM50267_003792 [Aspergillus niger]GLA00671.1 hypothetical protein AnigIFM60653_009422 [Aspergillus niger]
MKNRIPSLRPLCHPRVQVLPLRRNHSTSKPPNAQPQPRPQPNNKLQFKDIPATAVNYYWDTQAPDESQLAYADKVFAPSRHSPVKLWTLSKFRTTPLSSTTPEVAFLGRSNVGKSSLLNALMGQEICWTSSKPGRTQTMNAFGIGGTKGGESKVVLLDMPGYGKGSRSEWGAEIMKYLKNRKQLRRTFILIDGQHGIKHSDEGILELFRHYAIPHQIIVSKVDNIMAARTSQLATGVTEERLLQTQKKIQELRPIIQPVGRDEGPGALGEILTCSSKVLRTPGNYLGISPIRWAILSAAGYDGTMEVKSSHGQPDLTGVSMSSGAGP